MAGPSVPAMSHRSTLGHSSGSRWATSALDAPVTTTRDSESLMMYAASSAERYELTQVKNRPVRSAPPSVMSMAGSLSMKMAMWS